jgi:hypothetical protein
VLEVGIVLQVPTPSALPHTWTLKWVYKELGGATQLVWGLVPPPKVPLQLAFEPIPHEYPFGFGTSSLSHFARSKLLPTLLVFPWVASHLFSLSKGKRTGQTNYLHLKMLHHWDLFLFN